MMCYWAQDLQHFIQMLTAPVQPADWLGAQDLSRGGGSSAGKVRANFVGTEFVAYDRGAKPGSTAAIYSAAPFPSQTSDAVSCVKASQYEQSTPATQGTCR